MKTKNTVNYYLHLQYYKYNTGAADNGSFTAYIKYETAERAEEIWSILEERLKEDKYGTSDFLDDAICVDGYVEELLAIFKVETNTYYDDKGLLKVEKIETRIKS